MPAPRAQGPRELIQLLTRAERLMTRRLQEILDPAGYSVAEWRVLALLADDAGHRMTEIADRAFLPPATLTKLVDHLVADNLVYRRVDPLDRRSARVYLTPRGQAFYQRVGDLMEAGWAQLPATVGDDEGQLHELLAHLVDALDGHPLAERRLPVS
jgi:DNA-binding MarR family transcriptional regulator